MSPIDLTQVSQAMKDAAARGLQKAGEHVLKESNDHVPIEEATLERSGKVIVDGFEATISYDTPYAVVQHEDLSMAHDPGRTAKFLENALNGEKDTVQKLIGNEIRKALGT